MGAAQTEPLLRDQFLPRWQGLPAADLPSVLAPRGLDASEVRQGGGESTADVFTRANRFLQVWTLRGAGDLVVVTHDLVLRCLVTAMDGGAASDVPPNSIDHGAIDHGAIDHGAIITREL